MTYKTVDSSGNPQTITPVSTVNNGNGTSTTTWSNGGTTTYYGQNPSTGTSTSTAAAGGAAAALAGSTPTNTSMPATTTDTSSYTWGTPPTINLPGLNPGYIPFGVAPYYTNATSGQNSYYWGQHPYMNTLADLAHYNNITTPSQPFGAQYSTVGGTEHLNIPQFIQNTMTPQYQAGVTGSSTQAPGFVPVAQPFPVQPFSAPASYYTQYNQPMNYQLAAYGGAGQSPVAINTMAPIVPPQGS